MNEVNCFESTKCQNSVNLISRRRFKCVEYTKKIGYYLDTYSVAVNVSDMVQNIAN